MSKIATLNNHHFVKVEPFDVKLAISWFPRTAIFVICFLNLQRLNECNVVKILVRHYGVYISSYSKERVCVCRFTQNARVCVAQSLFRSSQLVHWLHIPAHRTHKVRPSYPHWLIDQKYWPRCRGLHTLDTADLCTQMLASHGLGECILGLKQLIIGSADWQVSHVVSDNDYL